MRGGRRRPHHADGRNRDVGEVQIAGKGDRHQEQRARPDQVGADGIGGNPQFGVELQPIDFAKVAEACGAAGFTIEEPKHAESVLRKALNHDGPAVVQAVVDANEPPLPGNINSKQALHFAEAIARGEKNGGDIVKTVLKDKVREVI